MINDFFDQHGELAEQRIGLTASINALIRHFRHHAQPVVWVRQEFAADLSDAFLDMRKRSVRVAIAGTEGCRILSELDQAPTDTTIIKKRYSAFFGTTLDDTLLALRPRLLVIAGVNTHACVRATVIDAYQRDYEVIVATEGTASYDRDHHAITKRYLDGKIARFLSNVEIVEMLNDGRAV